MGYIKYDCENFRKNFEQSQSKCSVIKLEKILYDFDEVEEEIKMEFLEVKETLEESKREIKELMNLNNKQDEIGHKINEWVQDCKINYESNWEECKCSKVKDKYFEDKEDVESLINEALYLVEQTLEKVIKATEVINKKRETYESIKDNCYPELCEDYRYCYNEYEDNYKN